MTRLEIPANVDQAPEAARPALEAVERQLGFVPNLHRLMSISEPTLSGFLALQSALNKTVDARTRESVALAVSQANGCDYCLAAHSYLATRFAKATDDDIALAREGRSTDPKRDAATTFARRLIETRGKMANADLEAVRAAGFSDKQIVELTALSVQFLLTNFMNNVAATDIDFPIATDVHAAS
jgi:uncharacterized peroxidase-related enzyme